MLFQNQSELEEYILKLWDMQEGLCALSGLKMQFHGEEDDSEMRCSLDRIDSDGRYAPGNLQVVCWFTNRWEGTTSNDEFKRLLRVVHEDIDC